MKTLFAVAVLLALPVAALARIGVGVGLGKVTLDQPLKPGTIYELPPLPVINTGDEPSEYEATVEYQEAVPQLRPSREWFTFSPQHFQLDPGKAQSVSIKLTIPVRAQPGEYFAYLEGHPLKKSTGSGGAKIGVAAAAKLYFTIAPANIFAGFYYRAVSLTTRYSPWTYIGFGLIAAAVLIWLFKKHFKFQIAISKKP